MLLLDRYEEYKDEIELIESQNRVECDLYSLIACLIRECDSKTCISVRDVSVRRETDFSRKYKGYSGFPDFVIRERKKSNDAKIYGAIEIKYITEDLELEKYVEQLNGHIDFYNQVIYTNGLEWRFYNKNHIDKNWKTVIGKIEQGEIRWESEKLWNILIDNLKNIEWSSQ